MDQLIVVRSSISKMCYQLTHQYRSYITSVDYDGDDGCKFEDADAEGLPEDMLKEGLEAASISQGNCLSP